MKVAHALGTFGEERAAAFLRGAGYEIIAQNWRCQGGELDIVARHNDTLVAVEVKTRRSDACGHPCEAVDVQKMRRLRLLLREWLRTTNMHAHQIRIDVIGVIVPRWGPVDITHVKGADW